MSTVLELILDAARRHPTRVAVWADGETITYGELIAAAERVATALLDAGVRPGDRVAILAQRNIATYVGVVAVLRAGCVYVPLNSRYPAARNRKMIDLAAATALLVDPACSERYPALFATLTLSLDSKLRARTSWPARAAEDDCYLIFTSGSTGEPKGVPITHANVLAYREGILGICSITHEDRVTQLADLSFDLSVHGWIVALTTGAALYNIAEHANLLATRYVEEQALTVWISVPSAAGLAKQAGMLVPGSLPTLRAALFCGEALHGAVARAFAAAAPNAEVINLYGPTEATVEISWYRFRADDATSVVPLGVPFEGQHMDVFGPDNVRLPDHAVGELLLAGSQVMRGYWEAPALDAAKFVEISGMRWYRTGDLARRTTNGFEYAGRVDHQTKIRGFRVELLEIERTLRGLLACDAVAVIAWPVTPDGGAEGTVAFVAGAPIDIGPALARMGELLPPYMVPAQVVWIDEVPLNSNGKTDYNALRLLAKPAP
jgi:amino acid adenylation domain-containing protein